jgi:hypothetical protein
VLTLISSAGEAIQAKKIEYVTPFESRARENPSLEGFN